MAITVQALIWASAIVLVALTSQAGLLREDFATFLVLTLPAIAWASIGRRRMWSCNSVGC